MDKSGWNSLEIIIQPQINLINHISNLRCIPHPPNPSGLGICKLGPFQGYDMLARVPEPKRTRVRERDALIQLRVLPHIISSSSAATATAISTHRHISSVCAVRGSVDDCVVMLFQLDKRTELNQNKLHCFNPFLRLTDGHWDGTAQRSAMIWWEILPWRYDVISDSETGSPSNNTDIVRCRSQRWDFGIKHRCVQHLPLNRRKFVRSWIARCCLRVAFRWSLIEKLPGRVNWGKGKPFILDNIINGNHHHQSHMWCGVLEQLNYLLRAAGSSSNDLRSALHVYSLSTGIITWVPLWEFLLYFIDIEKLKTFHDHVSHHNSKPSEKL